MPIAKSKRKWLRRSGNFPVKLSAVDSQNKKIWTGWGSAINIGGGGALLNVSNIEDKLIEDLVQEKYTLLLALRLPNFFFPVKVKAKVVWVEDLQRQERGSRKLGVSFKRLPKKKEDRIEDYVETGLRAEIAGYTLRRLIKKGREKKD